MKRFALIVDDDPAGLVSGPPVVFLDPANQDGIDIGRAPRCRLVVAHAAVGRVDCRVVASTTAAGTRCVVADIGSSNGVWVNDRRIIRTRALTPGDVLSFPGDVRLRFDLVDDDPVARATLLRDLLVFDLPTPVRRRAHLGAFLWSTREPCVVVISASSLPSWCPHGAGGAGETWSFRREGLWWHVLDHRGGVLLRRHLFRDRGDADPRVAVACMEFLWATRAADPDDTLVNAASLSIGFDGSLAWLPAAGDPLDIDALAECLTSAPDAAAGLAPTFTGGARSCAWRDRYGCATPEELAAWVRGLFVEEAQAHDALQEQVALLTREDLE